MGGDPPTDFMPLNPVGAGDKCWHPKISSQSETARWHRKQGVRYSHVASRAKKQKQEKEAQYRNGYRKQLARSRGQLRIKSGKNVGQSYVKAPKIQIQIKRSGQQG